MNDTPDKCPSCGGSESEGLEIGDLRHCRTCGLRPSHWPEVQRLRDENERLKADNDLLREEDAAQLKLLAMVWEIAGGEKPCWWGECVEAIERIKSRLAALKDVPEDVVAAAERLERMEAAYAACTTPGSIELFDSRKCMELRHEIFGDDHDEESDKDTVLNYALPLIRRGRE